jgi:hypothetical protein
MKRDLDHGDLICLLRRTNRLPERHEADWGDNGMTLGERFRRLSEHKLCKAAIVFATVKADARACRS